MSTGNLCCSCTDIFVSGNVAEEVSELRRRSLDGIRPAVCRIAMPQHRWQVCRPGQRGPLVPCNYRTGYENSFGPLGGFDPDRGAAGSASGGA